MRGAAIVALVLVAGALLAHALGGGLVLTGIALLCFRAWGWGTVALALGGLVFWQSWRVVGIMGVLAGFLILSYYSVIGGWAIGYIGKAAKAGLAFQSVAEAKAAFGLAGLPVAPAAPGAHDGGRTTQQGAAWRGSPPTSRCGSTRGCRPGGRTAAACCCAKPAASMPVCPQSLEGVIL